jgi:hypothetical protein
MAGTETRREVQQTWTEAGQEITMAGTKDQKGDRTGDQEGDRIRGKVGGRTRDWEAGQETRRKKRLGGR